jgi:hypothetical protein
MDGNGDRVHLAVEVETDGLNRGRCPISETPPEVDINCQHNQTAHCNGLDLIEVGIM